MKRQSLVCGALLLLALSVPSLRAATSPGTVSGSMVAGRKTTKLKYAWVVEKKSLLRIILSDQLLTDEELTDTVNFSSMAEEKNLGAVAIHLDEDRKAEEVFFFHPQLPAGLSVRELSRFEAKASIPERLAGRVVLDDKGNSFTYDATFDAPIIRIKEKFVPKDPNATPAELALLRLKELEIPFEEDTFRIRVLNGDAEAVGLLLEAGMPVETANALRIAVEKGHKAIAKALIAAGANVNAKDEYGQSVVMSAAQGMPEMLALLIEARADVSAPNVYEITPLGVAAEQGHLDIVKMLVAAGANVKTRSPSGGTALSVAVLRGHASIVKVLIYAGADVARDKKDLLDMAKERPDIRVLIEEGAKKKR